MITSSKPGFNNNKNFISIIFLNKININIAYMSKSFERDIAKFHSSSSKKVLLYLSLQLSWIVFFKRSMHKITL